MNSEKQLHVFQVEELAQYAKEAANSGMGHDAIGFALAVLFGVYYLGNQINELTEATVKANGE